MIREKWMPKINEDRDHYASRMATKVLGNKSALVEYKWMIYDEYCKRYDQFRRYEKVYGQIK